MRWRSADTLSHCEPYAECWHDRWENAGGESWICPDISVFNTTLIQFISSLFCKCVSMWHFNDYLGLKRCARTQPIHFFTTSSPVWGKTTHVFISCEETYIKNTLLEGSLLKHLLLKPVVLSWKPKYLVKYCNHFDGHIKYDTTL